MYAQNHNAMPATATNRTVKPNPILVVIMLTIVAVIVSVVAIKAMTPETREAARKAPAAAMTMETAQGDILTADTDDAEEEDIAKPAPEPQKIEDLQPLTNEEIAYKEIVQQFPHEDAVRNETGQIVGYASVGEADYYIAN